MNKKHLATKKRTAIKNVEELCEKDSSSLEIYTQVRRIKGNLYYFFKQLLLTNLQPIVHKKEDYILELFFLTDNENNFLLNNDKICLIISKITKQKKNLLDYFLQTLKYFSDPYERNLEINPEINEDILKKYDKDTKAKINKAQEMLKLLEKVTSL